MTLVTGINASLAWWHWQADEGLTCRLRQGRGGKPPKHPRFQNLTSLGMLKHDVANGFQFVDVGVILLDTSAPGSH